MRVLMLGWEFPPRVTGGLGTASEGIARALASRGAAVLFVLPKVHGDESPGGARLLACEPGEEGGEPARPTLRRFPVPSRLLPYLPRGDGGASSPARRAAAPFTGTYGPGLSQEVERYARAVARIAAARRFDIVHGHDWMTFPAAIAVARAARRPLVLHFHSTEWDRSPHAPDPAILEVEQRGIDAADRVVCVSRYTRRVLLTRYRADPRRVTVLHNAVGEPAPRRPRRRRFRDPVVLLLGRVTTQKGPFHLLEAAALVARRNPRVRFVVAGSGDLLPATMERAAALGLARHVHFTGFLSPREVERAYAEADIVVLPSLSEPFGLVPLEAARRGIPVVLSRRSGVAEVLPSAPRVDPWSVEALAEEILDLASDPRARRRLGGRLAREARRLSWDAQARRLLRLYGEVAA